MLLVITKGFWFQFVQGILMRALYQACLWSKSWNFNTWLQFLIHSQVQRACINFDYLWACCFMSCGIGLPNWVTLSSFCFQGRKIESTPLAMYNFFIERVRANLHVVLAMSPIGDAFRSRMRMFPSLINCCTIDWFQVKLHFMVTWLLCLPFPCICLCLLEVF